MFLHGVGIIVPTDELLKTYRSNKNKAALDNVDQSKLACLGPLCARLIYVGEGKFIPIITGNKHSDLMANQISKSGLSILQEYSEAKRFCPQLVLRQECVFTVPYLDNHLRIEPTWLEQVVASCSQKFFWKIWTWWTMLSVVFSISCCLRNIEIGFCISR